MHNLIMGTKLVDHKNGNGLDNQKNNLRNCTNQQNHMNRRPKKNCTSKFKGVCRFKKDLKWTAVIKFNRKQIYIGIFGNEEDAAKAYDKKAKELFGEFAYLNFP